ISGGDLSFIPMLMKDISFYRVFYHFKDYDDQYGNQLIGKTDIGYPYITNISIDIDRLRGVSLSNTLNFLSEIYILSSKNNKDKNHLILNLGSVELNEEDQNRIFNLEVSHLELQGTHVGKLSDLKRLSLIRNSDIPNIWLGEKYSKKNGKVTYFDEEGKQNIEIR
ncbi:hypothetical protein OAN96_01415, partial [Candidatus Gracilibacteria bacterium]|nr:hypothetical protein [Candidatus Gracilibacteria bacterium]